LNALNAENEFAWPFDPLKHRFIDFTKVGNQKCDIDKVEEDWFQVVEWH
jgi:hypothetical protein